MLTASLGAAALRIALAILLDTAALTIWDIGTRSPFRLFADVRRSIRRPPALARGLLRFVLGLAALLAAVAVSAPVAGDAADLTVIECWALAIALVVEQLLGPDVRALLR